MAPALSSGLESLKPAAWAGAGSGFAFMTVIEFLDAHSAEWGWSWSDVAANTLGSGLYLWLRKPQGARKGNKAVEGVGEVRAGELPLFRPTLGEERRRVPVRLSDPARQILALFA